MTKQISVELVDVMGNDLSVVNAARVSFNKQKDVMEASDEKLIKYLANHRHLTPFRHNQVQIRCKAPIFIARQLGKHQAGLSWNEVSRRYVSDEPEFYIPDEWRGRPEGSIKQGSGDAVEEHLVEALIVKDVPAPIHSDIWYDYEGLTKFCKAWYKENQHIAPELARMVLPQSMLTEWVWSGNILAFAHVYKERIAEGAQLEAQMFAKELDNVIRPIFPEAWSALVDD